MRAHENLKQHRAGTCAGAGRTTRDAARHMLVAAASACLVLGLRRRSARMVVLALAGGAVAWWAAGRSGARRSAVARLDSIGRSHGRTDAVIDEALAASFPASDPPAFASASWA
jgi:uncharacterized membrane protein